jgi:hypothetical protein
MPGIFLQLCAGLFLAGCATKPTSLSSLPPPSRHDVLEHPATVKTADLQYGEGRGLGKPDSFAPIITAAGDYPTQHEALHALQRASHRPMGGYTSRLFACAPGALNGETGLVEHYPGKPVVHCATQIFDREGRHLGQLPINYYYHNHKWMLRDAGAVFSAPLLAFKEPSLPIVRGKAVQ